MDKTKMPQSAKSSLGSLSKRLSKGIKVSKDKKPTSSANYQAERSLSAQAAKLIDPLRTYLQEKFVDYLKPVVRYYKSLSSREQLIINLGGVIAIGYLAIYLVISPYVSYRQNVQTSLDTAYTDYVWLSSQKDRVSNIILARGGTLDEVINVNEIVGQYLADAQIERTEQGYRITGVNLDTIAFFNAIQAVINRGGTLLSVELTREGDNTDYSALLNIS